MRDRACLLESEAIELRRIWSSIAVPASVVGLRQVLLPPPVVQVADLVKAPNARKVPADATQGWSKDLGATNYKFTTISSCNMIVLD